MCFQSALEMVGKQAQAGMTTVTCSVWNQPKKANTVTNGTLRAVSCPKVLQEMTSYSRKCYPGWTGSWPSHHSLDSIASSLMIKSLETFDGNSLTCNKLLYHQGTSKNCVYMWCYLLIELKHFGGVIYYFVKGIFISITMKTSSFTQQ